MNILVHGFNVRDPKDTTGNLAKHLGNSIMFNYGWFGLISVALYNKREAKDLKHELDCHEMAFDGKADVWGHSNGAAIGVQAAKFGGNIKNLILVNPALNVDTVFPENIDRIIVIYTKHDKATRAARFFDSIPLIEKLVINAWGAMGAKGYKGNDKRVVNLNFSQDLDGHSDFFEDDNLEKLLPIVLEKLI